MGNKKVRRNRRDTEHVRPVVWGDGGLTLSSYPINNAKEDFALSSGAVHCVEDAVPMERKTNIICQVYKCYVPKGRMRQPRLGNMVNCTLKDTIF